MRQYAYALEFSLDAFTSIPALLARAKSAGIGLAITDHNTIAGSLCAQKQTDVLIIPAIEVTTREGIHILAYFNSQNRQKTFLNRSSLRITPEPRLPLTSLCVNFSHSHALL